jgi:hypothetical protein
MYSALCTKDFQVIKFNPNSKYKAHEISCFCHGVVEAFVPLGSLHSICWQLFTDAVGQPIRPILKGLAVQEE